MSFLAERRIRHWLAHAFQSRSWERFDSLPVSRVDARFAEREAWLPGARWCLARALAARARARYPLAVAVSIELSDAPPGKGLPRSPAELESQLGAEAPALTAFPPGGELDELVLESPLDPGTLGFEGPAGLVCAASTWSFPDEPERVFRALYAGVLGRS